METTQIRIDVDVRDKVKAAARVKRQTLKGFTEDVLLREADKVLSKVAK